MAFRMPEMFRDKYFEQKHYGIAGDEGNGVFVIPGHSGRILFCVASNGAGWEHVSVSCLQGKKVRIPTWKEMCRIKDLFWEAEDCAIQFHPPRSKYVNFYEALHLWRPIGVELPVPEKFLIEPKTGGTDT